MDTFKFIGLLGHRLKSEEMQAALLDIPSHRIGKPSDGSQYVVSYESGIDLLFEDEDPTRGHRQPRILSAIFLYAAGAQKHKGFRGKLPFGFLMTDSRPDLLKKRTPVRTWLIGEGRVPVTTPNPSHDLWQSDDFNISAHYYSDSAGEVMYYIITPFSVLDESKEWKASSP